MYVGKVQGHVCVSKPDCYSFWPTLSMLVECELRSRMRAYPNTKQPSHESRPLAPKPKQTRGGPYLPTLRMLHKCTCERSKVMFVSRNQTVTVFGRLYACSLSASYVQGCVPILIQNNPHTNPDLWPQNPNRPESAPENGGRCRRHQV